MSLAGADVAPTRSGRLCPLASARVGMKSAAVSLELVGTGCAALASVWDAANAQI